MICLTCTALQDIDPLSTLPKLYSLSLVGNPVALKKEYRLYTISRCPHLKQLDFKKVKQKVRWGCRKWFIVTCNMSHFVVGCSIQC